jgi:transmembrane sensor
MEYKNKGKHSNDSEWKDIWRFSDDVEPIRVDSEKAYSDFLSKVKPTSISEVPVLKGNKFKIAPFRYWISAAAAVFLGVIATLFFSNNDIVNLSATNVATSYTLPDGSRVNLYPGASLEFDKSKFEVNRNVTLIGKALFDVAKRPQTFTITQDDVKISVLGTTFIVSPSEVKVLEGNVKITTSKGTINVSNREKVELKKSNLIIQPSTFSDEIISTESMIYDNEPLPRVISDLESQYKITITNPKKVDINSCLITSTNLSKDNLNECLNILKSVVGLQLSSTSHSTYSISSISCN